MMTTESITTIADLEASRPEKVAAIETARADVQTKAAELMAEASALFMAGNTTEGSSKVAAAQNYAGALKRAEEGLIDLDKRIATLAADQRWQSVHDNVAPIMTVLRQFTRDAVEGKVGARITGLKGSFKVTKDESGALVITTDLTPTVSGVTGMDEYTHVIGTAMGSGAAEALLNAEFAELELEVTGIGNPDAEIKVNRKGQSSNVAKTTTKTEGSTSTPAAPRQGGIKYLYRGEWMGPTAYLTALESDGDQVSKDRAQAFETALRGSKNGLSNLAKAVAAKLGHESKTE